jgi:hypothetical protein
MNYPITIVLNKLYTSTCNFSFTNYWRMLLPISLCVLLFQPTTSDVTLRVLADAFWQVAVFVAFTLAIYHVFTEKISKFYVSKSGVRKPFYEILTASFMGVLPGCGGAIIVITQFISGKMSFGAVTAVLTATMGDAAFLLLATEPLTGLGMVALCFTVGIISGLVVNKTHGTDFLRQVSKHSETSSIATPSENKIPKRLRIQGVLWQWLMIPGALIGLLMAGQVDVAALIGVSNVVLQATGAVIVLSFIFLWAATRKVTHYESIVSEDKKSKQIKAFQKVALDTNFVVSWVVVAFLVFEFTMLFGNFQLADVFNKFGTVSPLIGVLVGMIPGCGPQIITTSLYLSGAIPLSVQIGNAISNDGDALFPAIALSPKVALVATLYSSIPALISAYGYRWLFE